MNDLERLETALASLPPFPQIARQIMDALRSPTISIDTIVRLVERDVALTTAVLRASNSGLYGRAHRIGSVSSALSLLGTSVFSQLVMRVALKGYVGQSMPKAQLSRCWNHSLACAEISRILALKVNLPIEIAHASGMLHDLGRFGLAMALPGQYAKLSRIEGYVDALDVEAQIFGTDHTEVGRMLAEKFSLPDEIRVAAGRHHDPTDGFEIDNLAIVSAACSVASALGFSVTIPDRKRSFDELIERFPQTLRRHIDPDIAFWQKALLDVVNDA